QDDRVFYEEHNQEFGTDYKPFEHNLFEFVNIIVNLVQSSSRNVFIISGRHIYESSS
ncbi:42520_t:CDS:2, partial [Gigaspora margarita]